jgi:hypothetical protein
VEWLNLEGIGDKKKKSLSFVTIEMGKFGNKNLATRNKKDTGNENEAHAGGDDETPLGLLGMTAEENLAVTMVDQLLKGSFL